MRANKGTAIFESADLAAIETVTGTSFADVVEDQTMTFRELCSQQTTCSLDSVCTLGAERYTAPPIEAGDPARIIKVPITKVAVECPRNAKGCSAIERGLTRNLSDIVSRAIDTVTAANEEPSGMRRNAHIRTPEAVRQTLIERGWLHPRIIDRRR